MSVRRPVASLTIAECRRMLSGRRSGPTWWRSLLLRLLAVVMVAAGLQFVGVTVVSAAPAGGQGSPGHSV